MWSAYGPACVPMPLYGHPYPNIDFSWDCPWASCVIFLNLEKACHWILFYLLSWCCESLLSCNDSGCSFCLSSSVSTLSLLESSRNWSRGSISSDIPLICKLFCISTGCPQSCCEVCTLWFSMRAFARSPTRAKAGWWLKSPALC